MWNEESGDLPIPRSAFIFHHSAFLFHGGHGVTAALRPVTALVSVQIRLATPTFQDCGVISSISPCEGDSPGANPGFLTDLNLDGPKFAGYRSKRRGGCSP